MRVCVITRVTCNDLVKSSHLGEILSQVKSSHLGEILSQVKSKIATRVRVSDLTCYNTGVHMMYASRGINFYIDLNMFVNWSIK